MKRWSRLTLLSAVAALAISACSEQATEPTTTTVTLPAVTTTVPAVTTTTIDPTPCDSVFCVTYRIRPEANWSDGMPVTSADFVYTLELLTDPLADSTPVGYDRIVEVVVVDDKTLTVGFDDVYGPWRTLFDVVLPAHVGDPSDFSVTAGPFQLEERVEGDRIVLRRNTNYWASVDPASGEDVGDVEELEFAIVESVRDRLAGLEDGELDVINPTPLDWVVEEAQDTPGAVAVVTPGAFWEHIDFNHDDPLLSQTWVRRVIAMAVDREAILAATVEPIDANVTLLDNTIWMTKAGDYQANYSVEYDPVRAEEILNERFCDKSDDGIYDCQGRRMSFVWTTTLGDDARETVAGIVQESLAEIGIELIIDLRTPSELFSTEVFFGGPNVWQMIHFSWKAAADPHLGNSIFYCSGDGPAGFGALNVNRYCNDDVETLIRSTDTVVGADERASIYNEADQLYLDDIAVIPLYQKPALLAWNAGLKGLQPNMSDATDVWNLASWAGLGSVVFALGTEPAELEPFGPWNQDTALVMRSLVSGAFTITPDLRFVPVLIEDAETWVRDG